MRPYEPADTVPWTVIPDRLMEAAHAADLTPAPDGLTARAVAERVMEWIRIDPPHRIRQRHIALADALRRDS